MRLQLLMVFSSSQQLLVSLTSWHRWVLSLVKHTLPIYSRIQKRPKPSHCLVLLIHSMYPELLLANSRIPHHHHTSTDPPQPLGWDTGKSCYKNNKMALETTAPRIYKGHIKKHTKILMISVTPRPPVKQTLSCTNTYLLTTCVPPFPFSRWELKLGVWVAVSLVSVYCTTTLFS